MRRAPSAPSLDAMTYDGVTGTGRVAMRRLALAGVVGPVLSILVFSVAGALRRDESWRRWGTYSLAAAVVALVLVATEYAFLMPRSPLYPLHAGGLLERADFVWHYGWYVAFGYRLFRGPLDAPNPVGPINSRHA